MKLQFVSYDNIDIIKSNLKIGLIILSRIPLTGYRMNWETHCSTTPNLLKYLISAWICLQINLSLQKLKCQTNLWKPAFPVRFSGFGRAFVGCSVPWAFLGLCEIQMGH